MLSNHFITNTFISPVTAAEYSESRVQCRLHSIPGTARSPPPIRLSRSPGHRQQCGAAGERSVLCYNPDLDRRVGCCVVTLHYKAAGQ